MTTFECTYTESNYNSNKICSGIVISVFYNSDKQIYEAAVLEVDRSFGVGYNSNARIVPLDNISITPKKG